MHTISCILDHTLSLSDDNVPLITALKHTLSGIMPPLLRRWIILILIVSASLFLLLTSTYASYERKPKSPIDQLINGSGFFHTKFQWKNVPSRHPLDNLTSLPSGYHIRIPKIQHEFEPETFEQRVERQRRLSAVEEAFLHSWEGYKKNAWLQDEVAPLSGMKKNDFGGWGATMIDSLDTLWIMGLKKEFVVAVHELKKVHFKTPSLDQLNVFETTIRYLGGLLSAYDISGHQYSILLQKAIELGEMLYVAFDTPNRMPVTRWDWKNGALGGEQTPDKHALVAEVGSLTLEFTRLSQLTGNDKWYDAIARVTDVFEQQQERTKIPGLWPVLIDAKNSDFTRDITFTFGGMADSLYEYLPKQHLMLGGHNQQYQRMYESALASAKRHIFFQPMNKGNESLLISGTAKRFAAGHIKLVPQGQHLTCFAGGMVALAAKAFEQPHDLGTARQLVDGCLWAYESMPSGIMPEVFTTVPCTNDTEDACIWNEQRWHGAIARYANHGGSSRQPVREQAQDLIKQNGLAPGFTAIEDPRYILRPEAIESLFVLYRITGERYYQDKAWSMFQSISTATKTAIAYAAVNDVREQQPQLYDSMESFWTAETLKYFYLIFSEPNVISLDEYVL